MLAKANIVPLKVKEGTKFYEFLEWYEKAKSSVSETGRNRKGNFKKFIIEEFESMLISGKPSKVFLDIIAEFKESSLLPPQLQEAKQNLNPADFATFVELLEKAKVGI